MVKTLLISNLKRLYLSTSSPSTFHHLRVIFIIAVGHDVIELVHHLAAKSSIAVKSVARLFALSVLYYLFLAKPNRKFINFTLCCYKCSLYSVRLELQHNNCFVLLSPIVKTS